MSNRRGRAGREIIDVTDPYLSYNSYASRPVAVGSGSGPPPRPTNLPKFPNNTELVFEESNSRLLAALLPALNKYDCLRFATQKPRRSPFVRAFCDLYHPAGPWGSKKFSNTPDITSSRKYSFKSYQIPTLYKQLKKYDGDSASHLALKAALQDYYSKDDWYKDFLKGCERVAAVEVNKPMAERTDIPTVATGVVVAAPAAETDEVGALVATFMAAAETTGEETPTRRKRTMEKDPEFRPRTRARRRQEEEVEHEAASPSTKGVAASPRTRARKRQQQEEVDSPSKEETPVVATESTPVVSSPESMADEVDKPNQKVALERKRAELAKLLDLRRQANASGKDTLSEKIQSKIDDIDGELLELIMG